MTLTENSKLMQDKIQNYEEKLEITAKNFDNLLIKYD